LKASWIRWAILALIYVVFLFWYGGSGDPLSSDEIEDYLAIVEEKRAERSDSEPAEGERDVSVKMREFMETDDGREFVMINLNVYRDVPRYQDGRETSGSAEEVEQEYGRRILPNLLVRATHPLLMLEPAVSLGGIGEFERQDWSRVNLVRYRSRRDFLDFILKTSWAEDSDHKWAALGRSHSLAATPRASFATVRLVPLLILVVIGLVLDRIASRLRPPQGSP
jgi:hypothetical protein